MDTNQIATKEDIQDLKNAILKIESILGQKNVEQKLLRSADVCKRLGISSSTLQRMRISGTIKAHKKEGTWFYKLEDINKMFQ